MKSKIRLLLVFLFFMTGASTSTHPNGFVLFNHGARAAGMANAFVARASDPSAVWYNPAGLTQLPGLQVYVGGAYNHIGPSEYYSIFRDTTLSGESFSNVVPNLYLSYRLSDRIGLGLGLNTPAHYHIEWPKTHEVEHLVYVVSKLDLRTTTVSPALAFRLNDRFSVGAGLNINFNTFALKYHYPYDTDVLVALLTNGQVLYVPETVFDLSEFKTTTTGFYAGLQWKINPNLVLGATYRRGTSLSYDSGNVNAWEPETPNEYANSKLRALFPDSPEQSADISFASVDQLNTGIALKVGKSLELELDFTMVFWSHVKELKVDYALDTQFRSFWSGYYDFSGDLKFRDTATLQLGGEYQLNQTLVLRLGTFLHGSPITENRLNPAFHFGQSRGFSLGAGYQTRHLFIDAAYVYRSISELAGNNSTLLRWGDDSQKYLSKSDSHIVFSAGMRF